MDVGGLKKKIIKSISVFQHTSQNKLILASLKSDDNIKLILQNFYKVDQYFCTDRPRLKSKPLSCPALAVNIRQLAETS